MTSGVGTTSLAHTKADAKGGFTISLDPSKAANVTAAAAANDGWSNLMALTVDDGRVGVQYFSRQQKPDGWVSRSGTAAAESSLLLQASNRITQPAPGTDAARQLSVARRAAAAEPSTGDTMALSGVPITEYPNVATPVARVEVPRNSSAAFTYSETQDTDFDIGISYDAGKTFSISGSAHMGTSTGYEVNPVVIDGGEMNPAASYVKIGENFEYQLVIYGTLGFFYQIVPTGWTGNIWQLPTGVDACSGRLPCAWEGACYKYGDGVKKWGGRNVKFAGGVSVGGISLGATSGWSKNVQVQYKFGIHGDTGDPDHIVEFCLIGSNDWPTKAAQLYGMSTTTPPWGPTPSISRRSGARRG